jgi:hypothetical protein
MQPFVHAAISPSTQAYQLPTMLSPLSVSRSLDLSSNVHASAVIAAQIQQVGLPMTPLFMLALFFFMHSPSTPSQLQKQLSFSTSFPLALQPLTVASPQPPLMPALPPSVDANHPLVFQSASGSLTMQPNPVQRVDTVSSNTTFEANADAQVRVPVDAKAMNVTII